MNKNLFFNNELYNQHSFSPNKKKIVQFNSTSLISKQSSREESEEENKKFFFLIYIFLNEMFYNKLFIYLCLFDSQTKWFKFFLFMKHIRNLVHHFVWESNYYLKFMIFRVE
jgi:hypothetical protein